MIKKYFGTAILLFAASFVIAQVPTISSFAPASGPVGSSIVLTGSNFKPLPSQNTVYFGDAKAMVTAATATSITAIVPAGATFKPLSVKTDSLTGFSNRSFVVTFPGNGDTAFYSNAFGAAVSIADAGATAFADFDGDGITDMAGRTAGNLINIYKNGSNRDSLSFTTINLGITAAPDGMVAADFNGDGKPDLAIYSGNGSVGSLTVFKNTSTAAAVSFTSAYVSYFSASSIYSLVSADVDGDGKTDLLYGSTTGSNPFSIRRNIGVGGEIAFANAINISGFFTTDSKIITGDIDGDNKPDVLCVRRYSSPFTVYRNTSVPGTISFASMVSITSGYSGGNTLGFYDAKLGDLDGDGKADLAFVSSDSDVVSLYKNASTVGSISFGPKIRGGFVYYPINLAFNDMNGDGKADLVVLDYSNVTVLENKSTAGNILLGIPHTYTAGTDLKNIYLADIDRDGRPDIVAAGDDVKKTVVLKSFVYNPIITSVIPITASAGTPITIRGSRFTGTTSVNFGGIAPVSFSVLSDTVITAVLANGATGNVAVTTATGYTTFGGFTFSPPIPFIDSFAPLSGPVGATVTIKGKNFGSSIAGNIVRFGAGIATVTAATDTSLTVTAPTGTSYLPVSVTVTGSHLSAFSAVPFTTTFGSTVTTFSNSNFGDTVSYVAPSKVVEVTTGDFDDDRKPDIAASIYWDYSGVSVYKNVSPTAAKPAFTARKDFATYGATPGGNASGAVKTVTADIDGDGKVDMATISNGANTVSIFRNRSNADSIDFANKIDFDAGNNPTSISTADLDNDGKPDIAITNPYPSARITILKNVSSPGTVVASKTEVFTASVPGSILLEDFDNDGKKDIGISNYGNGTMSFLRNISTTGTIAFAAETTQAAGSTPTRMVAADLDGDGKIDIMLLNNSPKTLSVFRNISTPGNILFAASGVFSMPEIVFGLTVADLDGDARPDIIIGSLSSQFSISLFKNNSTAGNIVLAARVDMAKIDRPNFLSTTDVNNDGTPDIISGGYSIDRVTILPNIIGYPVATSLCPFTDSTILLSGITGTDYQWQLNTGNGFVNIDNSSTYSGANSSRLVIKNVPSSWYGYQYRCVVDNRNSDTYVLKITARWLGTVNGAWENPANWGCGQLPDANTDVLINSGSAIVNSNVIIRSIQVNRNAGLNITTPFNFTILH